MVAGLVMPALATFGVSHLLPLMMCVCVCVCILGICVESRASLLVPPRLLNHSLHVLGHKFIKCVINVGAVPLGLYLHC